MDSTRFDTIAKFFASRKTRRAAIAGGLGLAATAAGSRALGQQATPVSLPDDPHPSADEPANPAYLFVQPFDSGTWAPKEGEDGVYTLTLAGAAANTVYFSDRPERIVGLMPTQQFLDTLGFSPDNPPNAALVAQTDSNEQGILVIELLNPSYDTDAGTLTYDARVMTDYGEPGLAHLARQQTDYELPESFGEGGLFIDGCSDTAATCYQIINGERQQVGSIDSVGCCGDWDGCSPCNNDSSSAYYGKLCNEAYPDQCSYDDSGWDCFVEDVGKCGL